MKRMIDLEIEFSMKKRIQHDLKQARESRLLTRTVQSSSFRSFQRSLSTFAYLIQK